MLPAPDKWIELNFISRAAIISKKSLKSLKKNYGNWNSYKMSQSIQHLENLKSALMSLQPIGEKGFEGLIGVALREISGVPFRLAHSGSQFGVDGKPAYEGDAICFEGKRYDGPVHRTEVLSKLAGLSIRDSEIEIWVLGATSSISSQLADDARNFGLKNGISVLILDWSEKDLPPFAVALVMGGDEVRGFLKSNISDNQTFQNAIAALDVIMNSHEFAIHAERIKAFCSEPAAGLAIAQRMNADWLNDGFSNRKSAKTKFGQPLSPGDTKAKNVRQRKILIDKLHPYLTDVKDKTTVFILGGEGNGKSWIIAQSWLILPNKPLMIFMSPDDFAETAGQNDFVELLIFKLIKQTGDVVTESTRERWRRRLKHWRSSKATYNPRLIAIIDGINQRPNSDWGRLIESIGDELNQLGGRLIVTTRTPYFRDCLKGRLSIDFIEIDVPEWTESELDEFLSGYDIKGSDLYPAVAKTLRNPRLLGIALELLDMAKIPNFEELSVSRLLFEHIRMSERDAPVPQPAKEFARRLQKHALEIVSRLKAKQQDDINIFDDDMGAVADGRFFQAVDGDPTRYSLKDDGLTLALGFAVIDRLCTAKRNNRNLDVELDEILDPISALDDTADVILSALTVTTVNEYYEQDIATAFIKGFAVLQNPNQSQFPAFAGLAKIQSKGFMDAARLLSIAGAHHSNYDWIQMALIIAGRSRKAWQEMAKDVHLWLSVCSLSPKRGTFPHSPNYPEEKLRRELEKNSRKIEEELKALSNTEREIMDNLLKEEGDLSALSRLAILLLIGKPLSPFAGSLLNWSFSYSLNSDHTAPYKEFMHLVSFNRVDWSQTRKALLDASASLRKANISKTGKWALVTILRATGHSEDGKEAQVLVEHLTKDMPRYPGWRLIEQYCATDPCDPESEEPENVARTAEQYAAVDVSKLFRGMVLSSEDHYFNMACSGIARFKPSVAIAKHREFAANVINRTGFAFRQGLIELRQHNALLTIKEAQALVKKRDDLKTTGSGNELTENDAWFISQYILLIAFPFLCAKDQVEILLSDKTNETVILDLLDRAKPLCEHEFESLIGSVCAENNEHKQFLLLELAKSTSVPLSAIARIHISKLLQSKSNLVRAIALGVVAQSGDRGLLRQVAQSDWKARDAETEDGFEYWFGSIALLEAAAKGLIPHTQALDRISERLYGRAATMLDIEAVCDIARRIDVSINNAANLDGNLVAPDIELQVYPVAPYEPSRFSLHEPSSKTKGIKEFKEAMKLLSDREAFEQRQRRNYELFIKFKDRLKQANALIILDPLTLEEFGIIVAQAGELAERWYKLFMNIDESKLQTVYNFVLLLACAFMRKAPEKAINLFRRVKDSKPLVRFTFSKAGVQLDAVTTWAGVDDPMLNKLCFDKLGRLGTDFDLSIEVLAALLNGQQKLLTEYIEEKLQREEPTEISRGIMVAGFSDQSEFNSEIIKRYESYAGLIGSAQKAAKYAYERNVWARYWFEKMCQTDENEAFWYCAILFLKIVDGRVSIWQSKFKQEGRAIQLFWPSIESLLGNRFHRWADHRNKKLFGMDAPVPIFFENADLNV
jgi:hypothetical protein